MTEKANNPPGGNTTKSPGKMRARLKAIMNANEPPEPGPLQGGMGKGDWVAVQSFHISPGWYTAALRRNHIKFRLRQGTKGTTVFVRYSDLGAAHSLYDQNIPAVESSRRPSAELDASQKAFAAAARNGGIGMLAGAFCGIVAAVVTNTSSQEAGYPAIGSGAGAAIGVMVSLVIQSIRRESTG